MATRRDFLTNLFAVSGAAAMASVTSMADGASSQAQLTATPACTNEPPTPRETEGPFFKPASPQRASLLEPGLAGRRLIVTGRVLSSRCEPLAGALLDFWQADSEGNYDNVGFRLRGHQLSDAQGRYRLETIVPGLYPGRTRHIHVKVAAPGHKLLTTQLYFPGEARNAGDSLFDERLLLAFERSPQAPAGFDFVL